MMPGKGGYDLCRGIRKADNLPPIILLTTKGKEIDKVVGLELGADDYITKPFCLHELRARIAALPAASTNILHNYGKNWRLIRPDLKPS